MPSLVGSEMCIRDRALWFVTQNGMYLFLSIMIFSFGEMASSPKVSEYIGRIAPKDKTALYMGTSFLPLAGGNFFAGILSGDVYTKMSDKIYLLKTEVAARGLKIPEISDSFTQTDYINTAAKMMGMNSQQLTHYLWNTYHPSQIWMVFSGIGALTGVMLLLYDKLLLKSKGKQSYDYQIIIWEYIISIEALFLTDFLVQGVLYFGHQYLPQKPICHFQKQTHQKYWFQAHKIAFDLLMKYLAVPVCQTKSFQTQYLLSHIVCLLLVFSVVFFC
eukprot:TRINITY_DN12935_c0_g1_i1.p1 TRINITY_DN12935_c0_g1~~TRINITY_DN12935_c0_g1_i1.p1  ORF type:complete len:274 (-),score=7.60 TRINITY_DN12935_c0_g1_i1:157-978(-)